jgi:hypothetical protein
MAYKTEEMIEMCMKAIEENGLMFIDEIIAFVPFTSKTFYNHNLQEIQTIKDAIYNNKIGTKVKLKKKWADSDNATLQVALYKLIGDKEEYIRLANSRQEIDHTTKGQPINSLGDMTFDELYELKYGRKPDRQSD